MTEYANPYKLPMLLGIKTMLVVILATSSFTVHYNTRVCPHNTVLKYVLYSKYSISKCTL